MKNIYYFIFLLALSLSSCQQNIEWLTSTWAEAIYPEEGATVKIDFFQPDSVKLFTWRMKENASYKILFDVDMHFQNPKIFDMGHTDTLKITNKDLLAALKDVYPDFKSINRFFWRVEESLNGETVTTWRYFDAVLSVESFTDSRDGQVYEAAQFVLSDGSLMTIMSENLRAAKYADGSPLAIAAKDVTINDAAYNNDIYKKKAGKFYTWATATRLSWNEAKTAAQNKEYVQGVCPSGWHLPSSEEINLLQSTIGKNNMGVVMKDPTYWRANTKLTNSAKMNIVATGYYWNENSNTMISSLDASPAITGFWTATPCLPGIFYEWNGGVQASEDNTKATSFVTYDTDDSGFQFVFQPFGITPGAENRMFCVRCIMNE